MFLWSAYAGVQFCAYEQLRSTNFLNSRRSSHGGEGGRGLRRRPEQQQQGQEVGRDQGRGLPPAISNFVYGSLAAFTATLLTYPLDITRTALAFQVGV